MSALFKETERSLFNNVSVGNQSVSISTNSGFDNTQLAASIVGTNEQNSCHRTLTRNTQCYDVKK
jgi:hypothetical protein